jgi:fission process protein 1
MTSIEEDNSKNVNKKDQIINTTLNKNQKEYDIYKDSLLRYLGYSNEIGESLRHIIPLKYVYWSWILEFMYFFGDTFHKGHKAYNDPKQVDNRHLHVIKESSYTVLWQFFATCVIPPLCIRYAVNASHNYLSKRTTNGSLIKYGPLMIGLSMIPLSNIYIDPLVGNALDHLFEKH